MINPVSPLSSSYFNLKLSGKSYLFPFPSLIIPTHSSFQLILLAYPLHSVPFSTSKSDTVLAVAEGQVQNPIHQVINNSTTTTPASSVPPSPTDSHHHSNLPAVPLVATTTLRRSITFDDDFNFNHSTSFQYQSRDMDMFMDMDMDPDTEIEADETVGGYYVTTRQKKWRRKMERRNHERLALELGLGLSVDCDKETREKKRRCQLRIIIPIGSERESKVCINRW